MPFDLSQWFPSILSIATALVIIGGYLSIVRDHTRRLDKHDGQHEATERHDAAQDVALAKLESWQEGYAAARAFYDKARD